MQDQVPFISAARLIALLTVVSRILGLIRECLFSYFFSTSQLLSAFRIAFMAPNLARRLFGEGALSAAMIPILAESLEKEGEQASRRLVGSILLAVGCLLSGFVLLIELVLSGWRLFSDDPILEFTALLIPYMVMICLVAIVGGVLNLRRHFVVPASCPMVLNLAILLTVTVAAWGYGLAGHELIRVICWAILFAGVIQLALSGLALRGVSFFPIFRGVWGVWGDRRIRRVLGLMAPMVLGLSAVQLNTLADYLIAYAFVLEDGQRVGPAVLGYAQYLYQLPLGVFGIAIATAIFPEMSTLAARGEHDSLRQTLSKGLRLSVFIALPASVGLMIVAKPLVATLYEHGAFDASRTQRVSAVLVLYSLGIVAYFVQHLLVRAFYSLQESRTPARIALGMVAVNLALNLILVGPMEERGLALATATCAFLQIFLLGRSLRKILPHGDRATATLALLKMLIATGLMAGAVGGLRFLFTLGTGVAGGIGTVGTDSVEAVEHIPALVQLIILVPTGVIVYIISARLLGIEEIKTFRISGRFP